jgi:hypothetical protein
VFQIPSTPSALSSRRMGDVRARSACRAFQVDVLVKQAHGSSAMAPWRRPEGGVPRQPEEPDCDPAGGGCCWESDSLTAAFVMTTGPASELY